jgi:hypothetical protein
MKAHKADTRVRRSVLLPASLVDAVRAAAPVEIQDNLNRVVVVALQEYASNRQRLVFEEAMARMAADPQIIAESALITDEFRGAEADGLPNGPQR